MNSTKYSLNGKDFLKGALVAIGTSIFPIIMQSINAGQLVFDWKLIATAGIGAFLTYIAKNFLTDDTAVAVKTLAKQDVTVIENKPTN